MASKDHSPRDGIEMVPLPRLPQPPQNPRVRSVANIASMDTSSQSLRSSRTQRQHEQKSPADDADEDDFVHIRLVDSERHDVSEPPVLLSDETTEMGETTHDYNGDTSARRNYAKKAYQKVKRALDETRLKTENAMYSRPDRVILPTELPKKLWDIFILGLLLYVAVVIPLMIGFDMASPAAMGYVVTASFMIDIAINFRVAYLDECQQYVTDPRLIAKRYFTTWFWPDFIAALPLDVIVYAALGTSQNRLVALTKIPRLLPLFKLPRLMRLFRRDETYALSTRTHDWLRILYLFLGYFLCCHWFGCLWYLISQFETPEEEQGFVENWITRYELKNVSLLTQYTASIYWAMMTLSTTGYGDVVPGTIGERWYATMTMYFGVFLNAIILGFVTSLVQSLGSRSAEKEERFRRLDLFISTNGIPEKMRARIYKYVARVADLSQYFNVSSCLEGLPLELQAEASLYMHFKKLRAILPQADDDFLKYLSLKMQWMYCSVDEYIVKSGDLGNGAFFLHSGRADIIGENGTPVGVFQEHECIGAKMLFERDLHFSDSVRATTHCDVFYLSRTDFEELAQKYPSLLENALVATADDLDVPRPQSSIRLNDLDATAEANTDNFEFGNLLTANRRHSTAEEGIDSAHATQSLAKMHQFTDVVENVQASHYQHQPPAELVQHLLSEIVKLRKDLGLSVADSPVPSTPGVMTTNPSTAAFIVGEGNATRSNSVGDAIDASDA